MDIKHHTAAVAVAALVAGLGSATLWAANDSQDALKAEAKISLEAASQTALAKVPGGTIKSSELEREHGKLIWSFDISKATTRNITEVQVDAKTGKVVSETTETPRQQQAEARKEQGEHK
ncbi:MAG: PepSY domain-containing protein [Gammaproteobacteria bacterium]|nr:PepSY domain-containing protein [Gammaproteobacteria bacterium]MDE2252021.1 PepSY domain-containing protein [Gammaproteobacteria bacterium]